MADVRCECGHLRGEHREVMEFSIGGVQLWCWECECNEFRPAEREAIEGELEAGP